MTSLPPSLLPWEEPLSIFPKELALAIGPWLPRLALAFGRLPGRDKVDDGEPDGLHGLARRGPIERLSLSEWLLADAEPLELERRLVMGEALFLELARKAPAGDRRSVVLFDAGPSQIGPPRILHLAALIVLSTRAAEARARFIFGVLQAPTSTALETVNERSVLRLIEGRSPKEPTKDDWARWSTEHQLQSASAQDDLWVIGSRRVSAISPRAAIATIEEAFEARPRQLLLELDRRGQRSRLTLECPADRPATRLLRNPFEVPRRAPEALSGSVVGPHMLLLSPSCRQLWVKTRAGVLVYRVNAGDAIPPRHLSAREQVILALGESKKQVAMLTSDGQRLTLIRYGRYGRFNSIETVEIPEGVVVTHPTLASPIADLVLHRGELVTVDAGGQLLRLSLTTPPRLKTGATGVLVMGKAQDALSLLCARDGPRGPKAVAIGELGRNHEDVEVDLVDGKPIEGFCTPQGRRTIFAIRLEYDQWFSAEAPVPARGPLAIEPDLRVVGLAANGLVAIGPGPTLRILAGANGMSWPLPAVPIATSVRGFRIAHQMPDGAVEVIDAANGRSILKVKGEVAP